MVWNQPELIVQVPLDAPESLIGSNDNEAPLGLELYKTAMDVTEFWSGLFSLAPQSGAFL